MRFPPRPAIPRRSRRVARAVRWERLGYVPAAVALARARRKLRVPRPVTLVIAYGVPVAVASALPRGRGRAGAVWLAHMWAYKVAFEVPYDRPEKLRQRLRIDQPIRADARIGGGSRPRSGWPTTCAARPGSARWTRR